MRKKPYSQKLISTLAILLLHHPPFISHNLPRGLTTLSEETTQRKHTYVTTIFLAKHKQTSLSLNNNKLSLATNKQKTPAKIFRKIFIA